MKYIRTKDGITLNNEKMVMFLSPQAIEELKENYPDIVDECKQADTIEELCDVFVLETDGKITTYDKAYFTCFSEDWYHNYLKAFDMGAMLGHEMSVNGYGAVHIKDKGLIYVAKMNEDGVLCLI